MTDTPKLRVLHLIGGLGKGGAERYLIDLCTELQGRQDVDFVIGALPGGNAYRELTGTLPIVELDYQPFSFSRPPGYPGYKALLEDFRPHVVHTHLYVAEFLSAHHVRDDVTYVCHCHDNMAQFANLGIGTLGSRGRATNWLEKRYLLRNKYRRVRTSFLANSQHTLAYFRSVLPQRMRNDVHLLKYGFNYDRFHASSLPTLPAGEPLRLVNVGSFQVKKNQIFIVRIAEELRTAGVDFEIHLLGDGAERQAVQRAVHDAGLADRILLHGVVDDVEEWLRRSHVYLHTALYEPFGLVLLEAMAAGLPCVVLDGKGNRDLIEQGRNGYLLGDQDAAAFARHIVDLSASAEGYTAMSAYAQAFAKAFDIPEATDRVLAFYRAQREGGSR